MPALAEESPAKRQKLDEGSYYKQIDGVKYDRKLLEEAEAFAKDGQISFAEAKALWENAQDGEGVTEIEKQTLLYTLKMLKYTDKAAAFLKLLVEEGKQKSYYKQIDGVKYDRELLETAEGFAKDGQISFAEARALWEDAQDGKGVTEIEKLTLLYTLKTLKYTDKAAAFLKPLVEEGKHKSYYRQIDGVKYDRELLEMAEGFGKDGQISFAEAKALWEDAQDGKGVTEIEKQTLLYTLKTLKYTDKAAAFLKHLVEEGKQKSYYKQIDGVKYDRELLEAAERCVKDGQISDAEARTLWEDAQDGKGITDVEKQTFLYTVKTLKYTDKAAAFMKEKLGGM